MASEAVFGGEPIGEDLGYGPARLTSAGGVTAVAARLRELEPALRAWMDPAAMEDAGVYPLTWGEDDVFDTFLTPAFTNLRAFYSAAARSGEAVIKAIR